MEQEVDKIKLVEEMLKENEKIEKHIELNGKSSSIDKEINIKEQEKEEIEIIITNIKDKMEEYENNNDKGDTNKREAYIRIIENNTKMKKEMEAEIQRLKNKKKEVNYINKKKLEKYNQQKESMATDKNIQDIIQGIKEIDNQIEEKKFEIKKIV